MEIAFLLTTVERVQNSIRKEDCLLVPTDTSKEDFLEQCADFYDLAQDQAAGPEEDESLTRGKI